MRLLCRSGIVLGMACLCFLHSVRKAEGFDHNYTRYDTILKQHVQDGLVAYSGIREKRAELEQVLLELREVGAAEYDSWTPDQQLAFWVNGYNAWMIAIVADRYPLQGGHSGDYPANSVQQIPGVWDSLKLSAAGREVSLNDIEHEILRKKFREPRIHFVLVCASIGCPKLLSEPIRAVQLESQLQNAATLFLQDPEKIKIDAGAKQLWLSSIFQWFPEDFETFADEPGKEKYGKFAGAVSFVFRHLPDKQARAFRLERWSLKWLEYDWKLNEKR